MVDYLKRKNKPDLAYLYTAPPTQDTPTVVFAPGFRSNMNGIKASYLENVAQENKLGYLRFDYSGHGQSGGDFNTLTLSCWCNDMKHILKTILDGPSIIVGSSMGGWISLCIAQQDPHLINSFIGLATAADFTHDIEMRMTQAQHQDMIDHGFIEQPTSHCKTPHRFTRELLTDGQSHFILDKNLQINGPVTLMHGLLDKDVPWQKTIQLAQNFEITPEIILFDQSDHRLSSSVELNVLKDEIQRHKRILVTPEAKNCVDEKHHKQTIHSGYDKIDFGNVHFFLSKPLKLPL